MHQYVPEKMFEIHQIQQLEEKFETDMESGLISSEANRRLSENKFEYLAKEKKRSWLRSAQQECLDPLFFFLFFLCFFPLIVEGRGWQIPFFFIIIVFLFKGKQIIKDKKFIQTRKECLIPKAQVLRDGNYQYMDVREIVIGDILWLKKGKRVPATVESIHIPGKIYEKGAIFPEESGKAIAVNGAETTALKTKGMFSRIFVESDVFPLRAQELLFREGIIPMETAEMPREGQKRIILLDSEYFPSPKQRTAFRHLSEEMKKKQIPLVLFTDKSKDEIFLCLKQDSMIQERRNIVDREQFLCYSDEILQKQIGSIQIYTGLKEKEKRKIITFWEDKCDFIYFMKNRNQKEEKMQEKKGGKGDVVIMALLDAPQNQSDFYFKGHWIKGILQLIQGEDQWILYEKTTRKLQEKILIALCLLNGLLFFAGFLEKRIPTFSWMFFLSTWICGVLAVWKELYWIWICRKK